MWGRRIWGAFVFLLVLASLAACGYLYTLRQKDLAARAALEQQIAAFGPRFTEFKDAVRDVDRRLSATVFQEVDLGASGWQPIAGGFYVIDLTSAQAGKGTKISGRVINPTSVTHEQAQLSIKIGEHRATFTLPHVPPAIAQPFEVVVPGVAPADAKRAYVALDSSTISFSSTTTRKPPGNGPVDTDKLLR